MGSREFCTSYITTRGRLFLTFSYEAYLAQAMIDTLSIARDLSEAGVDWAQAHATVIAHAVEQQHSGIATNEFVRNKISSSETRIIRWTVGTTLGDGGLIMAALTLL